MKKSRLNSGVILFATIESGQHEALRTIAFEERRSIADVAREAIDVFLTSRKVKEGEAAPALPFRPQQVKPKGRLAG